VHQCHMGIFLAEPFGAKPRKNSAGLAWHFAGLHICMCTGGIQGQQNTAISYYYGPTQNYNVGRVIL